MSTPWYLLLPLTIFSAAGAWFAAAGIESTGWSSGYPPWTSLTAAAALQLTWTGCAASSRSFSLATLAWALSFWLAAHGAGLPGVLVQILGLLLARALRPFESAAERLARWRRSREAISVQLDMGQGIFPWFGRALSQFASGRAPSRAVDTSRVVAEMQDAELMARSLPSPAPARKSR